MVGNELFGISIMKPMSCIACRKELKSVWPEGDEYTASFNQPYAATTFISYGHYGSTLFDPMDGTYIELNICDECLEKAAVDGLVLTGGVSRGSYPPMQRWNPKE